MPARHIERGAVIERALALLRRRPLRLLLAGLAVPNALSGLLPLFDVPGYESALLASLLAGLGGGLVGIAAGRQDARRAAGTEPDPAPPAGPLARVVRATAAAAALTLAATTLPAWLSATIAALVGGACSLVAGLGFYLLLPLPTALLAAAVGVAIGGRVPRRLRAAALYGALLVVGLAFTAAPILLGPQIFAFHHLLGWVPGPLYDEAIPLDLPLVAFRAVSVAWLAIVLGAAGALLPDPAPRVRPAALALLLLGLLGVTLGHLYRTELGLETTPASLEKALGASTSGRLCRVVHPRELPKVDVRRFVASCDHHVGSLATFFDVPAPAVTTYLYRSSQEKRRLVGAAGTQFAKPWRGELHVDPRGFPHPVLRHELAHVVARAAGRPPFGVTGALLGLVPVPALVEGAAVAAEDPAGELTLHEQAQAMLELGLLPSLPKILSPLGFGAEAPRRAYVASGSFVQWLVQTRGARAFHRAYFDADFEAAYGAPLPALVAEWQRFLGTTPLTPRARELALRKFRRPSIFGRPCARELAERVAEADAADAAGDLAKADELRARCAALDPGDPGHLLERLELASRQGRATEAQALAQQLLAHRAIDATLRAEAHARVGDAFVRARTPRAAAEAFRRALTEAPGRDLERQLQVKLALLEAPALAEVALPYIAGGDEPALLAVARTLAERPDWAIGHYLVGRRLGQRGADRAASDHLGRSLALGLPHVSLEREALRLLAHARLGAGDGEGALAALAPLLTSGLPGERLEAEQLQALFSAAIADGGLARPEAGTFDAP